MEKKRILIVEDEVAIAGDLQDIVEMSGYHVVGIAFSFDQALTYLENDAPDLAILDIELDGHGTGLDVARVINKKYQIPFVFLTSYSDQQSVTSVVELNPEGYLVKPFKEADIAPTLALALSNNKRKKKEVFPTLAFINSNLIKNISAQEYNVLKLLWQGKKNADIASALFVSINTIKTHINNIYSKLGVNSRVAAFKLIMQW